MAHRLHLAPKGLTCNPQTPVHCPHCHCCPPSLLQLPLSTPSPGDRAGQKGWGNTWLGCSRGGPRVPTQCIMGQLPPHKSSGWHMVQYGIQGTGALVQCRGRATEQHSIHPAWTPIAIQKLDSPGLTGYQLFILCEVNFFHWGIR